LIDALTSGKLIRDPTTKTGPSGKPYATFLLSAATNGEAENAIVSGIAFADTAEKIAQLHKGDALTVTGSLNLTTWNDRNTGEAKTGLNLTVAYALSVYDAKKRRGDTKGKDKTADNRNDRPFNDSIPI